MNRVPGTTVMLAFAAIALGAVAVWLSYVHKPSVVANAASFPTAAPVEQDYLNRDKTIAFWERAVREHHPGDMLSPSSLSAQYLQRYRERGDIGDILRALSLAQRSFKVQPYKNASAEVDMASALVALHRFKEALAVTRHIERYDVGDPTMLEREASIDLELGRYDAAKTIISRLNRLPASAVDPISLDPLLARYDELTGHLARARERFDRTTAYANAQYSVSAQTRAWFYFRSGELAFEAGDNDGALAAERRSLETFPGYSDANRVIARVACAVHRWQDCLAAAESSAKIVPYPEVLGYEVDAQRALGQTAQAARTDDLIQTIERIGNAQHVSDRLLAIYYSEHNEKLDDAYRIATKELAVRDDIFTEDTLAWAAAMDGRWDEARVHIAKALQFDTENSPMQYHAGMIALHFGDRIAAKRRLEEAIALNPHFHPFYADDARTQLGRL